MLGMSTGERWWSVKGEIAPARNPKEGVAMLGTFIGIKDGIEAILARDGITLRSVLSSKSSAQSQARIVGISRLSDTPYRKLVANRVDWRSYPTFYSG
ncbi:MAG: hypothetical protein WCA06_15200 [Terrimicrobiaceae bacterium]